jgi:hypothetical protein
MQVRKGQDCDILLLNEECITAVGADVDDHNRIRIRSMPQFLCSWGALEILITRLAPDSIRELISIDS